MIRLERTVSAVLRTGVVTSALVTAAGIVVTLSSVKARSSAGRAIPQLRRGVIEPAGLGSPHTLAAVLSGVGRGDGPALVMLGLLLLIVTPVARVAVSVVSFALDHDMRFVLITAGVLAVLLGSFAIGA